METIILKIIACSAIFIALYYLFLEKEKTFKFNRFYLLFALIFSYVVPFLTIKLPRVKSPKTPVIFQENMQGTIIQTPIFEESFDWSQIILLIYGIITLFFLSKGLISILKISKLKGNLLKINNQKVKILQEKTSPFSFLNTIYLGNDYVKNDEIDERIFLHEQNHIRQKHSWDLIFLEILKIISWFNPALYFYKKAVKTNHEFLADEEVLNQNFEVKSYQSLILSEILNAQKLNLTNPFNYNNTKKRFIMMTKSNSKYAKLKKILSFPMAILLLFFFAKKVYAQHTKADTAIPVKNEKIKVKTNEDGTKIVGISWDEAQKFANKEKANDTIRPKSNQEELPPPPPPREEASWYKGENVPPPPPLAYKEVDQFPEFPGGLNAMRSKVAETFDGSIMDGNEGTVKSEVTFVILENGEIDGVSAEGSLEKFNNEAIRSIKAAHEGVKWKPAEVDGKPVNFIFKLPLTMKFETATPKK